MIKHIRLYINAQRLPVASMSSICCPTVYVGIISLYSREDQDDQALPLFSVTKSGFTKRDPVVRLGQYVDRLSNRFEYKYKIIKKYVGVPRSVEEAFHSEHSMYRIPLERTWEGEFTRETYEHSSEVLDAMEDYFGSAEYRHQPQSVRRYTRNTRATIPHSESSDDASVWPFTSVSRYGRVRRQKYASFAGMDGD